MVRGRFHKLKLVAAPPHPDLLPARGEKEIAVQPDMCEATFKVINSRAPKTTAA